MGVSDGVLALKRAGERARRRRNGRSAGSHPAWIELSQSALTANVQALARRLASDTRLMAVVKANAYGHGLQPMAALLAACPRVQWLGVARFSEAQALRQQGVALPILVLGHSPPDVWPAAARLRIALVLHDEEQMPAAMRFARAAGAGPALRLHVKAETGMHRLGLAPRRVPAVLTRLQALERVQCEGLFTHFHSASRADSRATRQQWTLFQGLLAALERQGLRPPLCHCANTAAALQWPETHLDMVRVGGGLYGLNPDREALRLPPAFAAVLSWRTQVAQVRSLAKGAGLGYDRAFVAPRRTQVAVLPIGYGDGLRWASASRRQVLIRDRAVPLIGRICMDQAFADVTALGRAAVRAGDAVTVLGSQRGRSLDCATAAAQDDTIEYDVTTRIASRLPRIVTA